MKKNIFVIFAILQNLSLGVILFLLFRSLNLIHGEELIGRDTHLLLSVLFPLLVFIVEYIFFDAILRRAENKK